MLRQRNLVLRESLGRPEKQAEPLTFLRLPLEIQIYIIELYCALQVNNPSFQRPALDCGISINTPPVPILQVCRHFYQNFKPAIEAGWASRVTFELESIDVRSSCKEGQRILHDAWGFYTSIKVCYPPLVVLNANSDGKVRPKTYKGKDGITYVKLTRGGEDRPLTGKVGYYREFKWKIQRSDRYPWSTEDFLKKNFQKLKRVDGAPYCKSLQQWRTLLPNLQVINYTPVKLVNDDSEGSLSVDESPFQKSILDILDGSNDSLLAQYAQKWFHKDHMFTGEQTSTDPDLFSGLSITVAHILSLRRRGPWHREYKDYNFPANMLVVHVDISNDIPTIKRKEWRKSNNFLPNRNRKEVPGARFPQWELDITGTKIGLSWKEWCMVTPRAYRPRWDTTRHDRTSRAVAEEIQKEMENWAKYILLPDREITVWKAADIYNTRPESTEYTKPIYVESEYDYIPGR